MTSRAVYVLAAALLGAAASPQARAVITLNNGDSVALSTILASNDRQVNIGDKAFIFTTYTSASFPAANVSITGFIANNPNDGIGFDITGGFGDTTPGNGQSAEFNLLYTVSVQPGFLGQGYRIKDAGLLFNGAANGAGSYARVDESIFDPSGVPGQNLVATLMTVVPAGGPSNFQDYRDFTPQNFTSLEVNKDVQFLAVGAGDSASASFIRQTFSQVVVPTPGAVALFALGGVLVARRGRKSAPK